MPGAADKRFIVKVSIVMAVLVVVVSAAAFGWRPVLVSYHRGKMEQAFDAVLHSLANDVLPGETDVGELECRVQVLEHLGYHTRVELQLSDIPEDELQPLRNMVWARFGIPAGAYEHSMTLTYYAPAGRVPEVNEYVVSRDTVDFRERFGSEAEEAIQKMRSGLRSRP